MNRLTDAQREAIAAMEELLSDCNALARTLRLAIASIRALADANTGKGERG